ncbi:hypothetical protein [Saccharopolyspora phatthalungensis]|uniref:Uncharacterized protein n=1 Tax=Saccharopolyspora phatthalungensis TaxID=664693 RepID=A0A840QHN7_9PSEU|nr:hypothetical protein [Saccharopolyspora phatthalungensis]MBB5158298.1 hypothetical protein [Saccharopolyspora phatthalungensis]
MSSRDATCRWQGDLLRVSVEVTLGPATGGGFEISGMAGTTIALDAALTP